MPENSINETEESSSYDAKERERELKFGKNYKWIALSNTTLGLLMATIDSSILIISLPAIFNGLHINPLAPGNITLLLWLLLGYIITSSAVVVTIGRLSDIFGRVKLYNLGFAIFAIGSTMLYVVSYTMTGVNAVIMLIVFRLLQGFGGGFLFANSTAIITDAFPAKQRGSAMGINQIAGILGSLIGLIVGGVLSAIDWHLIFLISVPVGILGTIWSYMALHEIASIKKGQKLDILGNFTFVAAIVLILLSMTYALLPYNSNNSGWSNPYVMLGFALGIILLALFVLIEIKVKDPMFTLGLFKIRAFASGMLSLFLAGIARGGLQFMLIIWLQGIWLPLHGVSFNNTPLQAGIDMTPMLLGFLIAGPISGHLSDKYGARIFSTMGMLINVVGFVMLATLPANFNFLDFALIIFGLGIGQGMFAAPNTTAVMNAVPPDKRGATAGMRATFMNISFMFSIVIFFTLLALGLSSTLTHTLYSGLIAQNVPPSAASLISKLPPSSTLFAALLGYNPIKVLLPSNVTANIPAPNYTTLTSTQFFPNLISSPFIAGMHKVMGVAAIMTFIAAIASFMRGKKPANNANN